MFNWLKRIGRRRVEKYDLNEYARRFLSGDELPTEGTYSMSPEASMRIATVFACVRVLSETIASLPCQVYRRTTNGGFQVLLNHPLTDLLYRRPNRWQTAFEFWEMLVGHIMLRGNAVCVKIRSGESVKALIPYHPSRVRLEEQPDGLVYHITLNDGATMRVLGQDVFHLRGLCSDSWWGLSPIAQSKDTFKLARQLANYATNMFESGGAKRVLLKWPKPLSDAAYKKLKDDWQANFSNNARTAILEEGGDAATIGMNADEAEYIESRRFSKEEICGIFRVPPHMVADLSRATYSNIEKQDLFFVKHTVRPWLKRIESAIGRDLIVRPSIHVAKFNVDALLRGDIKTRTEAMRVQFSHGIRTLNEWRAVERLNPVDEPFADQHFIPNNLMPIEQLSEGAEPEPAASPEGLGGQENEPKAYLLPIARDIAARLVNREVREASQGEFKTFIEQHRKYAFNSVKGFLESAEAADEILRKELSADIIAGLAEGCEIDIDLRNQRIVALLMAAAHDNKEHKVIWATRAAAALARIKKRAAACT
jgi:HK97 family phage portal protein